MSLTPNFTGSQSSGALTTATLTDASTGDYTGITGRLVYFRKFNGSYLVPSTYSVSYVFWPVVSGIGDTLSVASLLDKDYALDISVQYYSGSTLSQTKTILTLFKGYSDEFLRQLTEFLSASKAKIDSKNFWANKIKLRTLVDDATQAVSLLNDQTTATFCLDEAKKLTDNLSLFFD